MVAKRPFVINPYIQTHNQTASKTKEELKAGVSAYFAKHPFLLKAAAFIGMPIGILLAVGGITAVWSTFILAITSLM